jgi:GNAT superfamily N-acetyltransferase
VAVGEVPDGGMHKNLGLLQKLEDLGALHITTARQNGRMFGYLLALTAPSLADAAKSEAFHTSFYASPVAPGVGTKLQRASVEFLRRRGVDQVFFRAGVRGSGPRMGSLYRRMGAEPFGEMFALDLKGHA